MDLTSGALVLTGAGFLLLAAVLLSPVSQRLGVPVMLVFLAVGMLAGEEGPGGIPFEDYESSFDLGTLALVLILFDGGLNTRLATLRSAARPGGRCSRRSASSLTAALTAGGAMLLGLSTPVAVLAGCVVSSTDAAAVFSVLRGGGVRLRGRTAAILEVESGLNDPMAMLLTVVGAEAFVACATLGADTALFFVAQLDLRPAGRRRHRALRPHRAAPRAACRRPDSTRWSPSRSRCSRSAWPRWSTAAGCSRSTSRA